MKSHTTLAISLSLALSGATLANALTPAIPQAVVIPRPASLQMGTESPVQLPANVTIEAVDGESAAVGEIMAKQITQITGQATSVVKAKGFITLHLDLNLPVEGPVWRQEEAYTLTSGSGHIQITARTPHGLFNGAQTLYQLLSKTTDNSWQVPALKVIDQPRFHWRGLSLDVSRHFFTVDEVRRFIDLMALHKYNVFHWHLTDDQGWRIEVKRYPKLTMVGAYRAQSPTMGNGKLGDGTPYGGFYTQDEIRSVVAYAAARFITIVPELDMPGHSTAAIAAYPELGNTDIPNWKAPQVGTTFGVHRYTYSPREETFQFLANVFDEVLPLFPGEYVHLGGDEAPKDQWKASPEAQAVMSANGLKNEEELQSWFVHRVEKMVNQRGKRLVGWDEIEQGGLSPSATVMVWHGEKPALNALEKGNDVVMASQSRLYLDFGQPQTPLSNPAFQYIGRKFEKVTSIQQVYDYEPIPNGLSPDQIEHVLGAEGQLWSEFIWSPGKLEYMTWPRACALSEILWSPQEGKNWNDFQQRLAAHEAFLDGFKVNYCREDGSPAQSEQSMNFEPHAPPQ